MIVMPRNPAHSTAQVRKSPATSSLRNRDATQKPESSMCGSKVNTIPVV